VKIELVRPIRCGAIRKGGAIRSRDVLLTYRLANAIVEVAKKYKDRNNKMIIWGNYLLPYASACINAKESLDQLGIQTQLWLTPTGSDIWELGPQLYYVVNNILNNQMVDHIIVYSDRFRQEIQDLFKSKNSVEVVWPSLDLDRFKPISDGERASIKGALGIPENSFVISSHSNMRSVKCPQDVVYLADYASAFIERKVYLIMVGPRPKFRMPQIKSKNLSIIWCGIIKKVEDYLWASDVEINCSWHDSFNLSLAEAKACGVPCVSTDVVGIGPLIREAEAGYLFAYESASKSSETRYEGAARYISKLSQCPTFKRRIGENAAKYAAENFCKSKNVASYLSLIK
jgi:glycosyltransferase involved in cell wall biosynthesis